MPAMPPEAGHPAGLWRPAGTISGHHGPRSGRSRRRRAVSSIAMRFRSFIVFARLCGAAGLGVFLGAGATGLVNVISGNILAHDPTWLTGAPVLAMLGALLGFLIAWITRRWFAPHAPYRRTFFTLAGALTLPLATAVSTGPPAIAFPLMLVGAALTITLWGRGFRWEIALARQRMYGRPVSSR